jgi:asparagine synthase (glutamine-hydrolysing)
VHLYAIAADLPHLDEHALRGAVVTQGADFALDADTAWSACSTDGRVTAAGVHHALELCGSRRYTSLSASRATWFDGLPAHAQGHLNAHDAAALAANWSSLAHSLDGQFSAVDFALSSARVELQTDTLGMSQVFWAPHGRGVLVSNSATLIAGLLELNTPDPVGVSSFLGLGWAVGTHTTTRDLHVLPGGARHEIVDGSVRTRRNFGPADVAKLTSRKPQPVAGLADELTRLTASAVRGVGPISCALTAGKDTRVMAALVASTGEEVLYYTMGTEDVLDVIIARELAREFGLRHEVTYPDAASSTLDWSRAATLFMRQNDGLVSLQQLPDYVDLEGQPPALGVKVWGMGGEIGRAGTGAVMATATTMPIVRRSVAVQRRLLGMKVRNEARLMTADALAEMAAHLEGFQRERLHEGWRPRQVQEAFYTFERIGRWGATGPRRTASTHDIFTPFCSRPFIEYCFSLSSGERYLEAAHYRLLSELSPALRGHRFEIPFQAQHAWLAPTLATRQLLGQARQWLSRRNVGGRRSQEATSIEPEYPFQHAWFEQRLGLIREMFSSRPGSQLWSFLSRPRVEELLGADQEAQRALHQEELLRATTLFWHFHGPPA